MGYSRCSHLHPLTVPSVPRPSIAARIQRKPRPRWIAKARVCKAHGIRRLRRDFFRLRVPELLVPGVSKHGEGGIEQVGCRNELVRDNRPRYGADARTRRLLKLWPRHARKHPEQFL